MKSELVGAYENDKGKYATNARFNVDEFEVTDGVITKLSVHVEYWARGADGKLGIVTNIVPFKCNKPPIKDDEKADTTNGFSSNPPGGAL